MSVLLRITAGVSFLWAVTLLGLKDHLIAADQLSPITRALANGLGIAQLVLACVFWYAALAPAAYRGVVYGAITLLALRTANDLYELLVLLPGDRALVSLADLVVSVALLVGILEALPRMLARGPNRAAP